jgi:hypothetical protein
MKAIRILNPVTTGARFTSVTGAERHVSRGRAKWVSPSSIRMVEDHHAIASGQQDADKRQSAAGYDTCRGVLQSHEVRRIPVIMPEIIMTRMGMYASPRWLQSMKRD